MAGFLLPDIGSAGIYQLAEPFDTDLIQGMSYTCRGIRSIADIIASGKDPRAEYYDPKQIDQTKYDADVAAGVTIVSLQPDSGQMVYVPSSYIISYPASGGVPYRVMCLAVQLSALPNQVSLAPLITQITNLVHDTLGIEATITETQLSNTELVESGTAAAIEAARQLVISNRVTDTAKLNAAQQQVAALQQQVTTLENYIRDHLAPPP